MGALLPDAIRRLFELLAIRAYIVLEPAVGSPGWRRVAPLVGSRPGSGMGLLMLLAGGVIYIITTLAYAWPKTRGLEKDSPDYSS